MVAEVQEALDAVVEALDEAHHFWHECADTYHDPTKFRVNLNAFIQAARNVTFRAQAHKKVFADFEPWYATWQDFLRADALMKWAHDARTQITKQRGLSANSRARARIIWSYLPAATSEEKEVPPDLPTPILVSAFLKSVPEALGNDVLVEVTREWQFDELPGKEVLGATGDILHVLASFVSDLHRLIHGESIPPLLALQQEPRSPCLIDANLVTTVRVNPRTGAIYTHEQMPFEPDESMQQKVIDRYGPGSADPGTEPPDIRTFCTQLLETGKAVLKKDKHHVPILLLRRPNGEWLGHSFLFEDRLDKFILWHRMADEVRRHGYDAFVLVAESWLAEPDAVMASGTVPASFAKVKGRKEALTVQFETATGERGLWATFFHRRLGKIVFDETIEPEVAAEGGFPEPIRAAWRERAARATPDDPLDAGDDRT